MNICLDLTRTSRERAIGAWLAYHGISKADLARQVDVDPSFITYFIQGKRKSRRIHQRLLKLGMPPELLPAPGNGPGRPRKKPAEDAPGG